LAKKNVFTFPIFQVPLIESARIGWAACPFFQKMLEYYGRKANGRGVGGY
jgi:hypothetical protein